MNHPSVLTRWAELVTGRPADEPVAVTLDEAERRFGARTAPGRAGLLIRLGARPYGDGRFTGAQGRHSRFPRSE